MLKIGADAPGSSIDKGITEFEYGIELLFYGLFLLYPYIRSLPVEDFEF